MPEVSESNDVPAAPEVKRRDAPRPKDDGWGDDPGARSRRLTEFGDTGDTTVETRSETPPKQEFVPKDDGWGHDPGTREARRAALVATGTAAESDRHDEALDAIGHEHQQAAIASARARVQDALSIAPVEGREVLTAEDFEAIRDYTDPKGDSRHISKVIREGTITDIEPIALKAHRVSEAICKLPETKDVVYRQIAGEVPPDVLGRYQPGETVVENGYTSASLRPDLDWQAGNVQMVIKSEHGRLIDDLSEVKAEREVLFDRCSKFQVLDRQYDESADSWTIYMYEL